MAEEVKQAEQAQPEEKKSASEQVKTALKFVLGVVLIALGVAAVVIWWGELLNLIKGGIGLFLVLAGLITIAIARD